jgi:excisionase family DNA binding protein
MTRPARFLSVAAVAELLGVSDVTLYRAIQAGEFPAVKIRGRYVIPARAIDEIEDAAIREARAIDPGEWELSRRPHD